MACTVASCPAFRVRIEVPTISSSVKVSPDSSTSSMAEIKSSPRWPSTLVEHRLQVGDEVCGRSIGGQTYLFRHVLIEDLDYGVAPIEQFGMVLRRESPSNRRSSPPGSVLRTG